MVKATKLWDSAAGNLELGRDPNGSTMGLLRQNSMI